MEGVLDELVGLIGFLLVEDEILNVEGEDLVEGILGARGDDQLLQVLLLVPVDLVGLLHELYQTFLADIVEHLQSILVEEVHYDNSLREHQSLQLSYLLDVEHGLSEEDLGL